MVLAMLPKGSSSQIVIDPIAPTDAAVDDRIDTLKDHDGGDVVDTPESTITTATTTDLSTTSTRNDDNDTLEDAELIRQAEAFFAEQRHVKAAKLLRSVSEPSKLTAQHHRILAMADAAEQIYRELSQPHPVGEGGWSQVGNRHGHRHTVVYYKVTEETRAVTLRIETPIEASLLVPLLAVINESDLYVTWNPSWKYPRLGLAETACLGEFARGHKLVVQRIDIPYPFAARELLVDAYAVDAIDSDSHSSYVALKIVSVGEGVTPEGVVVGPTPKGVKRVDFDAGFLFRPCPPDHPSLLPNKHKHSQHHRHSKPKSTSSSPPHPGANNVTDPTPPEPQLLVSLLETCDGHVAGIPMSFINYAARVCAGQQWGALLQVAEEVRDGKRPLHQQRIAAQPELYQWMNDRARIMVAQQVAAAHPEALGNHNHNDNDGRVTNDNKEASLKV